MHGLDIRQSRLYLSGNLNGIGSGGLNVFTVLHKADPLSTKAAHFSGDLYIIDRFIVRFFGYKEIIRTSCGHELVDVEEFCEVDEENLDRKLF